MPGVGPSLLLRPFEQHLLDWLRRQGEEKPSKVEVSTRAIAFYREEVTDVASQKRFKAGMNFVDQFLAKTKTKDLVSYTANHSEIENGQSFYCEECGEAFSVVAQLQQHREIYHDCDKRFSCPHCGRGFKSTENLKIHIRTHTGEKPYNCDICNYASADPSNFRKHQKKNHGLNRKYNLLQRPLIKQSRDMDIISLVNYGYDQHSMIISQTLSPDEDLSCPVHPPPPDVGKLVGLPLPPPSLLLPGHLLPPPSLLLPGRLLPPMASSPSPFSHLANPGNGAEGLGPDEVQ